MTVEQALEILNSIELTGDGYQIICNFRDKALELHYDKIYCADGASKWVIMPKNSDFVIKFSPRSDDSEREVDLYEKAVACGLKAFFPETEVLTTISDIIFVYQKRVDYNASNWNIPDRTLRKYKRIALTVNPWIVSKVQKTVAQSAGGRNSKTMDELWVKVAISIYGKKMVKALCNFILENDINDLHAHNLGYLNEKPVILDFCGYNNR